MNSSTTNVNDLFDAAKDAGNISPETAGNLAVFDGGQQIQDALGIPVEDVKSSLVFLATMVLDDSTSIQISRNTQVVRDGHNEVIKALTDSKQDDEILAMGCSLNAGLVYPYGLLSQVPMLDSSNYNPNGGTPLYEVAFATLAAVLAKTEQFAVDGVQARTATLLVTDGEDTGGSVSVAKLEALVSDMLVMENHIIAGMSIDNGRTDCADVFRQMGIPDQWILTPKDNHTEIRKAFGTFSKSAVRGSQSAASFSQLGGFGDDD